MSISLQKGQGISLVKDDGAALTRIMLGLGWDAKPSKGLFGKARDIDLDASAVVLDPTGRQLDVVYYGSLVSKDRAIQHSGDNLTGDGDGDDEQILVDLTAVAPQVGGIVLTITSYSGHKFDDIENAFVRVVDANNNSEVARYNISSVTGGYTAMVVAVIGRDADGRWAFKALGDPQNGKTPYRLTIDGRYLQ